MFEELFAVAVAHLPDAVARHPRATDLELARIIASASSYGGRTDARERADYLLALADIVCVRRHAFA
jgi:hypothetical protein